MNFLVEPVVDETQDRSCLKFITMCALCSEDPHFCGGPGPIEA